MARTANGFDPFVTRMVFPHPGGNERNPSYWIETTGQTSYPPVSGDEACDVLIVGAGIAGVTCAYFLAKAGKKVVVIDRERMAMSETGHTTAHLQAVDDARLTDLVDRFGKEGAKNVWDGHHEAVRTIEQIAHDERISCDLERLPAFLYSPLFEDMDMLRKEMRLAREIGYAAHWADPQDVPFPCVAAVRFPDQGKFHPRKYLLGLTKSAERLGVKFFEGTEAIEVKGGDEVEVKTREGHSLRAKWLISASNVPWNAPISFHTKLTSYRTYAVGVRVPRGIFGDALYWDTLNPYHYTRVEHEGDLDLVILGGEDHKLADDEDTDRHWDNLVAHMREVTPDVKLASKWSGEVIETDDNLPLIGRTPGRGENELMISGDSGTGMTHGTLGALMLAEHILGRGTPWDELYDPARLTTGLKARTAAAIEGVSNVKALAKQILKPGEIESVDELAPGQGGILRRGLERVAVARQKDGSIRAVSGKCTHAGCTVGWNHGEQSWDCPCHGGRFALDGDVLHGPPVEPLAPVNLDDISREIDG